MTTDNQMTTEAAVRNILEEIFDRYMIYSSAGTVTYDSRIEKEYPSIRIDMICACYADNLGHEAGTISDYLIYWNKHVREPIDPDDRSPLPGQKPLFDLSGPHQ